MAFLFHNNYCFYFQNIFDTMANVTDCEYGKTNFWNKGGQIQVYHAFIDTVTMDSDILNSAWFIMHKRHKKKEKSKFKVKIGSIFSIPIDD